MAKEIALSVPTRKTLSPTGVFDAIGHKLFIWRAFCDTPPSLVMPMETPNTNPILKEWQEMTRRMGIMAGTMPYGERMGAQGEQMADGLGPGHHSTTYTTKRIGGKRKKSHQTDDTEIQDNSSSSLPPTKKAKIDNISGRNATLEHVARTQDMAGTSPFIREVHSEVKPHMPPALLTSLLALYELRNMKVISSSKIQTKVSAIIETIGSFSFVAATKPNIVLLHAKAPDSSKLITIIEIAKREIAKAGGKWYQYNLLGQTLEVRGEKTEVVKGLHFTLDDKTDADTHVMDLDDKNVSQDIENDEITFETMKTRLERAIEGRPKVQAISLMAIFLSRIRIDALKTTYCEQTNAST